MRKGLSGKMLIALFIIVFSYNNLISQDENIEKKDSLSLQNQNSQSMSKSTWGAIWRSLAVPGWGQLYVESYWKAPIFFAGSATLIYFIIYNNSKYIEYADMLDNMQKTDPDYNLTKLYREYYRDNRDMSGFYLIGVYLLATIDAYVGAHLYDFDISDDLSLNFGINHQSLPALYLSIKF